MTNLVPSPHEPRRGAEPVADARMLRLALDGAAQGAWDYDVAADRPSWDERTFALFGLEPAAPLSYARVAVDEGRIDLAWSDDAAAGVGLTWRERGGPKVAPPARQGFGLTMIEQALAREFGAEVVLDFAEEGLVCRIRLPSDRPAPVPS